MEREGNGGSEQSGQNLALRKMMEEIIEPIVINTCRQLMKPMVISTVHQVMEPVAEDLFRRVVKEEIQAVQEKLSVGGSRVDGNDMPKERNLRLKFLDEVSGPVQTGKELKGTKDDPLKVALFDETDRIVTCGPESSVKVEIVLLDASGSDDESVLTHEKFERKIIGEEDKDKPHFAKNVYIILDKGVGYLIGLKLGHGKDWTRLCYCRLGVRIMQNIRGIIVQEAWTAPFKVEDKRGKQYVKHDQPSLLSEVWRLDKIGRDGEPCKRLKKENIKTVQDFRFWLSVDPEGLQRILRAGDITWQTIVAHAHTCIIDDQKMYSYKSFTEPLSVIYNIVGELKGVFDECHFVPIDNLSADKKDHARKLLQSVLECSAFGERYKTVFNNESSLPEEVPYVPSDISTSTNSSVQQSLDVSDFTVSGNISAYQTTERGSSSQSTNPSNLYDPGPSVSLGSKDMGALCDPASGSLTDSENIDGGITLYDYEKPSLFGEVSQLFNICKDGEIHRRLLVNKINTVEEFLIELLKDHEKLRNLVNLETREWEATVSNALACSTDSRMYCYIYPEQKKGVIFDILGHVLGLCLDNYCFPTSVLSEEQMADAQELLASACKNWSNVKPFNDVNDLQHLTGLQPTQTVGTYESNTVASKVVGESSSRHSNASFHSVTSKMDDDYWVKLLDCRSPSPNPMHYYDTYSYNTGQIYDGLGADEGSGADAETLQSSSNPPKGMKRLSRLFSSFKEKMSLDHKKPKVG